MTGICIVRDNDIAKVVEIEECSPVTPGTASSFLSNQTARVDPSGDDSTGTIGDLGKPFLTVQAAISAFETASFIQATIDLGSNQFSEDLVSSIETISFVGTSVVYVRAFSSITLSGSTSQLSFADCYGGDVIAAADAGLAIQGEVGNITNSSGAVHLQADLAAAQCEDVTAAGTVELRGVNSVGTVSAPGFAIRLKNCVPRYANADGSYGASHAAVIDSAGSEVWATGSVIYQVLASGALHLIDSRVEDTNNAGSTVYDDVLLTNIVFPDADPHVLGAAYWVAGVLTRSAG